MDPTNVFKDAVDGLTASNGSKVILWGCLALIWHPIFSWQLPTCEQAVYPQKMKDPLNVFKDAVDGLFQVPWRLWRVQMTDIALSWQPTFNWLLATCVQAVHSQQKRDPSNIFKDAVDGLFQPIMMGLNGSNKVPWQSLPFIWLSFLSWQLPSRAQAVYPWYMQDPSNIFKDAVDGLFQGAMTALNGSDDTRWLWLALIWHHVVRWQLPTRAEAVYPQ